MFLIILKLVEKIEEKLWKRVSKFKWVFAFVPFLRMVAVCNSLSFGIVDEKSDIDLFVVAKKGRLFTVRFFLTLVLSLLGVRRHGKSVSGRFCLSFFVDESALGFSEIAIKKDLYLAYWVKKIVPVYGSRDVFLRFKESNQWVNGILGDCGGWCGGDDGVDCVNGGVVVDVGGGGGVDSRISGGGADPGIEILQVREKHPGINFLEPVLRWWQMRRASSKLRGLPDKKGTLIAKNILKFHDFDKRELYRNLYIEKFGDVIFSEERFLQVLKENREE